MFAPLLLSFILHLVAADMAAVNSFVITPLVAVQRLEFNAGILAGICDIQSLLIVDDISLITPWLNSNLMVPSLSVQLWWWAWWLD